MVSISSRRVGHLMSNLRATVLFSFWLVAISPYCLSIFSICKEARLSPINVWGKGSAFLSCLQVNFNEPLSMLQRLTEDLEYHELLDRAAKCENSLEQLCYVAAFTVSSYSTTVFRTSKPFNPLLGETFELDRLEENGYRSICEQVKTPSW